MSLSDTNHYFLKGGGEMGELIRAKDWSQTSLGKPDDWPQSLRTMVGVMLDNPFGMYIAWGHEFIQLYNDGYRPILGSTKHPQALGSSTHETFAEIWHIIGSMFEGVMNGKAVGFPDFMLPLNRNGFVEECYFDFSYSPIRQEDGQVGGVLVTVIETTQKKQAITDLAQSEQRFRTLADNIPNLAWMANADGWIYWYNKKWYDYTGTSPEQMAGWGWQSVHDPTELNRVLLKWNQSIATGEPFEMVFPLKGADNKYRQFLTRVSPVYTSAGKIYQWFGSNTDITDQKEAEQALKESDQRFRDTVKQAPVGITILRGRDYIVEMANEAYLQLVAKTEAAFVGRSLFDSLPEVEETVHALLDTVLDTGKPFHGVDYPIPVNRYGKFEVSYFDFLYHPLKEVNGEISGIIVTVTDVTEKVASKKKIEESEQRFRQVADSAPVLIWMSGTDKLCWFFNNGWLNFTGRTMEQELGNGWAEGVHPDDFQRCLDTHVSSFDKRQAFYMEYRLKRYDGEYRWLSDNGVPRFTPDGEFEGYIGACMDITLEKTHQKELEESEQKFRLLADSMPQHIWTSDTAGNLNYFNQSVFDYSGLSLAQINAEGWIQIVHPDDRKANIEAWMNSICTGADFLFEHRFRRYDGEYRWQLSRAIPQKDETGEIQMWVGTSTDIEDQKTFTNELERQVLQRTKELAQNNIDLEKVNKELQSFAYISSHDLQEPLRKIQTFSTALLEKEFQNLSENGRDKFQRMQNAAKRMQTLINDLLSYSRSTVQDGKFEPTDLGQLINEVQADLQEELVQKNATIDIIGGCTLKIIPFQFRQLVYNFISNSLKFSSKNSPPHITINCKIATGDRFSHERLNPEMHYGHIRISDNGIGFEAKYSEKIFEVFQRLHNKNDYSGTGIGLAIVKKIVDNHNGLIIANGEPNKGATFDIYIPTT